MHSAMLLALPFLLPFASALPRGASSRDLYDLAARNIRQGSIRHAEAKRSIEDFVGVHDAKRMIRRKKRGSCASPTSTSTTAVAVDAASTASASTTMESSSSSSTSSTSPTSSASSAASSTSSAGSSGDSMMDWLFPVSGSSSWTTYANASNALSFTGALKPLTAGTLPATSTAPDGNTALIANYPANTFSLSSPGHGFSFYTEGTHNGVNVEGAKEVLFSYSVYFPSNFQFNKGGKMPGLYGGTSLAEAKSCSGGRQTDRDECFSARLMWRTNGMGEFYNYYPTSIQQGNGYCSTPPYSICDTVYGDSIGRGSFTWSTGQWTTVAQRVRLNDVGQSNGEQQLWVDGVPIMDLTGLQIVVQESHIYGIMAQTFFGGSDSTWDSPQDQSAWFKDWSLEVIA